MRLSKAVRQRRRALGHGPKPILKRHRPSQREELRAATDANPTLKPALTTATSAPVYIAGVTPLADPYVLK